MKRDGFLILKIINKKTMYEGIELCSFGLIVVGQGVRRVVNLGSR